MSWAGTICGIADAVFIVAAAWQGLKEWRERRAQRHPSRGTRL